MVEKVIVDILEILGLGDVSLGLEDLGDVGLVIEVLNFRPGAAGKPVAEVLAFVKSLADGAHSA